MAPKRASAKRSPDGPLETPLKKSRFNFDTGLRPGGKGSQGAIELDDEVARPPPVAAPPQARVAPKPSPAPVPAPQQTTPPSPLRQRGKTPPGAPQATSSNPAQAGLKFDGVSFVFTGELEQITRVEAEERVKAAGGKVGGGVSGNTKYLVVGSRLEDGRTVEETSKYRKYLELKEKGKKFPDVLREADFIALLPGKPTATAAAPKGMPGAQMAVPPPTFKGDKPPGASHHAWVSRHAPRSLDEVVGNASVVRKLADWLKDWGDVVLKGMSKRAAFKPGGGMPDNINARAALVSGPPGIGKTTACRLAVQLHGGYEVLEYNASDSRSQKFVQEMSAGIADNMTISFGGGGGAARRPSLTRKACIIFDEVDGMGAGDRGGIAALIRMIKKTRNPIICICNDSHNPKVRNLAFSCYDLKFTRPSKNIVAQRLGQIAGREGLAIEPNALESLADSCCSDMRMVLNQMQMLARSQAVQSSTVTYMDMKERTAQIAKDQATMLSAFEACKKLLNSSEGARMSFRDRLDMFFVDYNLMDLLVHENYLRAVERKPNDTELLGRCAFSADLMAMGDIVSTRIRQDQEWSLLPDMGVFGAVFPAHITNGFVPFPSFPQHLGKYSTMGRMRRLATELQTILQLSASVAGSSLQTSGYSELLYLRAMHPLTEGGPEAAADAARVLDAYGLRKEHLMEHLTEMRQHIGGDDLFKAVDPKVKAALTREFNSGNHAIKVVLPASKKRKGGPADEGDDPDGEGEEMVRRKAPDSDAEPADENGDDSDTGGGTLLKVRGGAKAKGKAKAKAKAAASSREPGSPVRREAASPKAKSKGRGRGRGAAKARA